MTTLISQFNFGNIVTATKTTSSTSQVPFDTFPADQLRSAKYQIQVTKGTSYHTAEFLVVHDGTTTYNTEYAVIKTVDSLATFDSDISGGFVRLLVTPTSSDSTTFMVIRTAMSA